MEDLQPRWTTPKILQDHVSAIQSIYKEELGQFLQTISTVLLEQKIISHPNEFAVQSCQREINHTIDIQMDMLDFIFRDAYYTSPLPYVEQQVAKKEEEMYATIDAIKSHALSISNSARNAALKKFKQKQQKMIEDMLNKHNQIKQMLRNYLQKVDQRYEEEMKQVQTWNLFPEILGQAEQHQQAVTNKQSKSKGQAQETK